MGIISRKNQPARVAVFIGLLAACVVFGEDTNEFRNRAPTVWPHVRGPSYDGSSMETGLLDAWPEKGLSMLWKIELGHGYSGFVVGEGRAYTQTQTMTGQYVVCLDANTGTKIWEHKYDWPYEAGSVYPGSRSTPTLAKGRIYAAGPRGHVVCLQATDGHPLWSVNVKDKFSGQGTDFGFAASPLVEEDKVILPVGGPGASVVALDANTGATVWQSGDEHASYSSAIPITVQGQRQVLALLQNALAGFDLKTGNLLWQEVFSQGYSEHATVPLYAEPYVMMASPFHDGAKLYRIEPNARGIKRVWETQELSQDVASSVLVDGHIYGFDLHDVQVKAQRPSQGEFKCLDFKTGAVQWATDETGHSSVIAADGKLILFNDEGELILVRVNPAKYEELSRVAVFPGETCWTAPALAQGRVYLRTQEHAACLDLAKRDGTDRARLQAAPLSKNVPKRSPSSRRCWLLGGEPEYLFEPPEMKDLVHWFAWSMLGILGSAAVIAYLTGIILRKPEATFLVFSGLAFVLAVVAMPFLNRGRSEFVFTWPVSLFIAFQITVIAILWSGEKLDHKKSRRISRLVGLLFLAICFGYYLLCRQLSLVIEWTFLIGFLPASPVAIVAARRLLRDPRSPLGFFWVFLAFAVYFWGSSSALFLH